MIAATYINQTRMLREYPENRKTAEGKRDYPWKQLLEGQIALTLLWSIAKHHVGDETVFEHHGSFARHGITKEFLLSQLRLLFPKFEAMYLEWFGEPLDPEKLVQRHHKMYHKQNGTTKAERLGRSTEHPRQNEALQPWIDLTEKAVFDHKPIDMNSDAFVDYVKKKAEEFSQEQALALI